MGFFFTDVGAVEAGLLIFYLSERKSRTRLKVAAASASESVSASAVVLWPSSSNERVVSSEKDTILFCVPSNRETSLKVAERLDPLAFGVEPVNS